MAEALNYTHVNLSWSKPNSRNEYITSYFVTMRDNSAKTVTNFTVTAPDTSLMVEALTGNTLYNFDVVVISVFIGEQLISNVTSTHVITPTGGEFDKFMYITPNAMPSCLKGNFMSLCG